MALALIAGARRNPVLKITIVEPKAPLVLDRELIWL